MLKSILFDWGGTVMEDDPYMAGPMADWPVLVESPGIRAVLECLSGQYQMYIATNAGASGAGLVRKALQRVELNQFFDGVYTPKEAFASKPTSDYYQYILTDLGLQPEEVVMVGDSLENDAMGAASAHLRSVWWAREMEVRRVFPLYDAEIATLAELPEIIRRIDAGALPTLVQIGSYYQKHKTPRGVIRHSQKVAAAAFLMAVWLKELGVNIQPVEVHRAGLLHDLDKAIYKDAGIAHGEYGANLLEQAGHPQIADMVRTHQIFSVMDVAHAPKTWEQKMVYLADKLVEKDQLAGVDARISGLVSRHPDSGERFLAAKPGVERILQEVCDELKIETQTLIARLEQEMKWIALYDFILAG